MDIDIVCSSRELFGSDRSAVRLAEVMTDLGHRPTLVLPRHRPERGLMEHAALHSVVVAVADVTVASSGGLEGAQWRSIWPRGDTPEITVYNTSAVVGCSRPSARRIVVLREWLERDRRSHRLLARWHEHHADAVVGISSGVLDQWHSLSRGLRPTFLCWNWLEPEAAGHARRLGNAARDRSGIVCLGRFNSWKGQELLAGAYELAKGRYDSIPGLAFVGAQDEGDFRGRADGLAAKGALGGWKVVPFQKDPVRQLAESALVVVPSTKPEPFGMVLLEALAAGCRVLATDGGGPSDLAPLFSPAITLCSRSREDVADKLLIWARDRGGRAQNEMELRKTYGAMEKFFSPRPAASRWAEILAEVS